MSKYSNLAAPRETHGVLLDLHVEIKGDAVFKELCLSHGLLWEDVGNEPRGYNGPAPEDVQVLYVSAEPGPVTPTERLNLIPAITNAPWLDGFDLNLQEHYWRKNLQVICNSIWPTDTVVNMNKHLGGMQSFWISLPEGATTKAIPKLVLDYWRQHGDDPDGAPDRPLSCPECYPPRPFPSRAYSGPRLPAPSRRRRLYLHFGLDLMNLS